MKTEKKAPKKRSKIKSIYPLKISVELELQKREKQNQKRIAKIARTQIRNQWALLLAPLSKELKLITVLLNYATRQKSEEHADYYVKRKRAFLEYRAALLACASMIKHYKTIASETPKTVAQQLRIINSGKTWVDWVEFETKRDIERTFALLPKPAKAKPFVPFDRVEDASAWQTKKDALIKSANVAIERLINKKEMLKRAKIPNIFEQHEALFSVEEQISIAKLIIKNLVALKKGQPLPATWNTGAHSVVVPVIVEKQKEDDAGVYE